MQRHNSACLIEGTDDVLGVDGLDGGPFTATISKRRHSAFHNNDFEAALKTLDIKNIVLCGVFMDGCVGLTAIDAVERGFDVVIVQDAVGHTSPHRAGLTMDFIIGNFEALPVSTENVLQRLAA